MNHDVIVTCAVTGAGDTVGKHPAIPVSPKQIADAAIDQINTGSELRLGTLISAAMLNPCVGRHFIARSAVH